MVWEARLGFGMSLICYESFVDVLVRHWPMTMRVWLA